MLRRRPPEPFPEFGQGHFERRTIHGPTLRFQLPCDRSFRVMNGGGGVEGVLDPCGELDVVPARSEGEAFGLPAELSTLEAAPHEAAPGSILTGEDLTKETERSGTLSTQELTEAPELTAAGVDSHVEESHVE